MNLPIHCELTATSSVNPTHAHVQQGDAAGLAACASTRFRTSSPNPSALNPAVATRIQRGESVLVPVVPKSYPEPLKLVTENCIQPEA